MGAKDETTTAAAPRTTLTIRFTPAELERVKATAEHHGLTASSLLRMLVAREARTVGVEPAAKGR